MYKYEKQFHEIITTIILNFNSDKRQADQAPCVHKSTYTCCHSRINGILFSFAVSNSIFIYQFELCQSVFNVSIIFSLLQSRSYCHVETFLKKNLSTATNMPFSYSSYTPFRPVTSAIKIRHIDNDRRVSMASCQSTHVARGTSLLPH